MIDELDRDSYYQYLDGLRESGITNMFGAAPYLEEMFTELTAPESRRVLTDWMQSFSERHPEGRRGKGECNE